MMRLLGLLGLLLLAACGGSGDALSLPAGQPGFLFFYTDN